MFNLVGKKVLVVDSTKTYSTYQSWLKENGIDVAKFRYDVQPRSGSIGEVKHQSPHLIYDRIILYLVEIDGWYYILDREAFSIVDSEVKG